jgi:hypothetical protein
MRILYYKEKWTPNVIPFQILISSICFFRFSRGLLSLPLQTRKQSLRTHELDLNQILGVLLFLNSSLLFHNKNKLSQARQFNNRFAHVWNVGLGAFVFYILIAIYFMNVSMLVFLCIWSHIFYECIIFIKFSFHRINFIGQVT